MKFKVSKAQIHGEIFVQNDPHYIILEGTPVEEEKKCSGAHCRCMNLDGECPDMHYGDCKEHNPYLKPKDLPKEIEELDIAIYNSGFSPEHIEVIELVHEKINELVEAVNKLIKK